MNKWFKKIFGAKKQESLDVDELQRKYQERLDLLNQEYSEEKAKDQVNLHILSYLYESLTSQEYNFDPKRALKALKDFVVVPFGISKKVFNTLVKGFLEQYDSLWGLLFNDED